MKRAFRRGLHDGTISGHIELRRGRERMFAVQKQLIRREVYREPTIPEVVGYISGLTVGHLPLTFRAALRYTIRELRHGNLPTEMYMRPGDEKLHRR